MKRMHNKICLLLLLMTLMISGCSSKQVLSKEEFLLKYKDSINLRKEKYSLVSVNGVLGGEKIDDEEWTLYYDNYTEQVIFLVFRQIPANGAYLTTNALESYIFSFVKYYPSSEVTYFKEGENLSFEIKISDSQAGLYLTNYSVFNSLGFLINLNIYYQDKSSSFSYEATFSNYKI